MDQHPNDQVGNYLPSFREHKRRKGGSLLRSSRMTPRVLYLAGLLLFSLTVQPILAQEQSYDSSQSINTKIAAMGQSQQPTPPPGGKLPITVSDAVSIFLKQNLDLVAARYDIDTADAEKLTARLRPNPEINVGFSDIPLGFTSVSYT